MPSYPVKKSATVAVSSTLEVAFRPSIPGVVKVISRVKGRPLASPPNPHVSGGGESIDNFTLRQKLELFKPGDPRPVVSAIGESEANPDHNELLVWRDYQASAADLTGGDWVVRVTNPRDDVRLDCEVTVRYPTVPGNLGKIDHVVVLMMENRSFDHMLGYLRLHAGRDDVDGLTGTESNLGEDGRAYRVGPLTDTFFAVSPGHGGDEVDEQLNVPVYDNSGFVKSFDKVLKKGQQPSAEELGAIMGYYTASQLPTYDFLAREFAICDRWFCSVPGATWPNRLYSLTGGSGGIRTNPTIHFNDPPGFELKTIFEHLQEREIDWTSYFSDLPFALVFKKIAQDATYTERCQPLRRFFEQARTGELPAVSWLDPNYKDVPESASANNDDHPPVDVARAQRLVAEVVRALASSPAWSKTLLVIIYDEHGGFYDHVVPPEAADDHANMRRYGVRVPAFVVSPWVARGGVFKETYDHTSILKTILLRFCAAGGGVPNMGRRVDVAHDLGPHLSEVTARTGIPEIPLPAVPMPRTIQAMPVRQSPDDFALVLHRLIFGF